jgi:uncharacterized protein (TIGR02569 family)
MRPPPHASRPHMPGSGPPSAVVLEAFGATAAVVRLPGGMGGTWRSGEIVLKRSMDPAGWHEWEARVLAAVRTDRVRIQRPRPALDGSWVVEGWVARDFVAGAHHPGRWSEIIEAGDAFHAALAAIPDGVVLPMPEARTDAWAIADRVAWEEVPLPTAAAFEDMDLRALLDARRPVAQPSQLVHGDLTGNVVFADGLAPGVIDFSPYLRPAPYAVGVIVADAVVWEGADLALLPRVADRPDMGQCLVRALIFRHVTALLLPGKLPTRDAALRYAALRHAAVALSRGDH